MLLNGGKILIFEDKSIFLPRFYQPLSYTSFWSLTEYLVGYLKPKSQLIYLLNSKISF